MITTYSLKRDGETNITPNFKVREFRSKCGSDTILIDVPFVVNFLQKIREHFEVPITVISAYRSPAHNKKVKGAPSSLHLQGRAFDIRVAGKTPLQVAQFAETLGIQGIIQYNTSTHIDSRTTRYFARDNNGKITKKTTFIKK